MKELGLSSEEIDKLPATEVEAYLLIIDKQAKERKKEQDRIRRESKIR